MLCSVACEAFEIDRSIHTILLLGRIICIYPIFRVRYKRMGFMIHNLILCIHVYIHNSCEAHSDPSADANILVSLRLLRMRMLENYLKYHTR